jgi:hypothetical protein
VAGAQSGGSRRTSQEMEARTATEVQNFLEGIFRGSGGDQA